ncbi:MAG: hypothetical protein BWY79_01451 [Actinobacteria bacterium ADurb.Bin444]|nr:MAG: hypothetical protein BWY79_01451 [Actinobacteria bacterium ADurb.Bin444]
MVMEEVEAQEAVTRLQAPVAPPDRAVDRSTEPLPPPSSVVRIYHPLHSLGELGEREAVMTLPALLVPTPVEWVGRGVTEEASSLYSAEIFLSSGMSRLMGSEVPMVAGCAQVVLEEEEEEQGGQVGPFLSRQKRSPWGTIC